MRANSRVKTTERGREAVIGRLPKISRFQTKNLRSVLDHVRKPTKMANSEEWLYNDVLDVDLEEVSSIGRTGLIQVRIVTLLFPSAGAAESGRFESVGWRRSVGRGSDRSGCHRAQVPS